MNDQMFYYKTKHINTLFKELRQAHNNYKDAWSQYTHKGGEWSLIEDAENKFLDALYQLGEKVDDAKNKIADFLWG